MMPSFLGKNFLAKNKPLNIVLRKELGLKSKIIAFRASMGFERRLRRVARKRGLTLSQLIRHTLAELIRGEE